MKPTKIMASTASKRAKRAIIVSMAAIAGTSVSQASAAMKAAMQDMAKDMGRDSLVLTYTYDPFDGIVA